MALNGEELMRHEEFKKEQYSRPTKEQLEIAMLEQQLQHAQNSVSYYEEKVVERDRQLEHSQNTINHLNNQLDRIVRQRDRINGHIALYENHDRKEGVTLDAIRAVLR